MNYYNYFTEIEEHFIRRRGKNLFISPLDWNLIASWRSSGVPLNVALRGIDIAMDSYYARPRPHDKLNTLAYCHDSVMKEYARHLDTHLGEEPGSEALTEAGGSDQGGPGRKEIAALITTRILEIKAAQSKQLPMEHHEGIDRVVRRLEEVLEGVAAEPEADLEALERDFGMLDELLIETLRPAIPEPQMAAWAQEARKDLKIYKKRLPQDVFEKIRGNYLRGKIHRFFGIGELTLFQI
jgi:hypothetical protein